jgi:hypothetical protein
MLSIMFMVAFALIAMLGIQEAFAQTDLQRAQNLVTCHSGRYPRLCKREWLTPEELKKSEAAERRENLNVCLTGRYTSLCNRAKLTPDETHQVIEAEKRENLKKCLTGRYKTLCKKHLLSEAELKQVLGAQQAENLRTCLTGKYPSLCDKALLTSDQLYQTQVAEKRAAESRSQHIGRAPTSRGKRHAYSGCESGHWVASVSDDGQIVKLEDGSIWEVDPVDAIDSTLWLPTTDIVVCDDKLINVDDNEQVSADRIR